MPLLFWALYFILGLIAGFFAGTLGIGGGFIIVPLLYWLFSWQGLTQPLHQAIATSLCVMIFTSTASAITHATKKKIRWKIFGWILLGTIVGSILGPLTSSHLPSSSLKLILAIFEILIGIYLILKLKPKNTEKTDAKLPLENPLLYIPLGIIVSYVGSLLGIGGGLFIVPALILFGYSPHTSIATSSVCIAPLALIATASYFFLAQKGVATPFNDVVNIPALITLSLATIIASPIGASCCYKLSSSILRVSLAVLLIGMGVLFFI